MCWVFSIDKATMLKAEYFGKNWYAEFALDDGVLYH